MVGPSSRAEVYSIIALRGRRSCGILRERKHVKMSTRIAPSAITLMLVLLMSDAARTPIAQARAAQLKAAVVDRPSSEIMYTAEQANRGQALFRRNCQFCHSSDAANQKTDKEPLRGFMIGDKILATMGLGGRYVLK